MSLSNKTSTVNSLDSTKRSLDFFNVLSKDQLTKKKDWVLMKGLISNKWKYKTKEARLILQSGIYVSFDQYFGRHGLPKYWSKDIYIPDCKISLASFVLDFLIIFFVHWPLLGMKEYIPVKGERDKSFSEWVDLLIVCLYCLRESSPFSMEWRARGAFVCLSRVTFYGNYPAAEGFWLLIQWLTHWRRLKGVVWTAIA